MPRKKIKHEHSEGLSSGAKLGSEELPEKDKEEQAQLPEHLRVQRDYVIAGEHLNHHV